MNEKTVLVIDTDIETIGDIESILESQGFNVFIASSKESSLSTAIKMTPSLIFVNISMSGVSGLEVCKAIHETESLKNIPIIITTPYKATIEQRYTDIYGIVDYIKKPFSPEELISKTADVLKLHPGTQTVQEEFLAQPPGKETGAEPVIEKSSLQPFELEHFESVHSVKTEPDLSNKEEKISDVQKETSEVSILKMPDEDERFKDIAEEKQQISSEEPGEEVSESVPVTDRKEIATPGKLKRRRGKKRAPVLFILLIILIGIAAVGIMQYKDWFQPTEVAPPVPIKPAEPVQNQVEKVEPVQEQQAPQQKVEKSKPESSPVPGTKPGKPVFHVQIGVFKNMANAEASAKKYKGLGYNAFTYKSSKNKEAIYRVLIGKFEKQKEAAQYAKEIRSKEKINAVIFHE